MSAGAAHASDMWFSMYLTSVIELNHAKKHTCARVPAAVRERAGGAINEAAAVCQMVSTCAQSSYSKSEGSAKIGK